MLAVAAPALSRPRLSPRARAAGLSPVRERGRVQVVRLIFVIYLLAIFEGSLRKWVLPQFGQYIFFIRDPFLLLAYALAARHRLWPRAGMLFQVTLAMCGIGVMWVALQLAVFGPSNIRLLLAAYGWRSYFLYVPLAFLVAEVFRADDLRRFYRLTLLLAVPIALLVTLQFFSPPGAAINVGNAEEEELQFHGLTVTAERTRPMGPFSSGAGQQQFVGTACAIVIGLLITPARMRRERFALLAVAAGAVMTCAALSGSRGTVMQCGLAVAFALGVGLIGRGGAVKGRAIGWPLALVAAAVLLYPIVFPEGFEAFTQRWTTAAAVENQNFEAGVFGRAVYGLVDFVRLIEIVPPVGYGLGYGGNASNILHATVDGVVPSQFAETDFSRHMVDLGPPLGFGYIVFRLAFAIWMVGRTLRVTRQLPDPMPMLLLSYVATVIVAGTITGQGAINVYGWLFAGVLMAACNPSGPSPARQAAGPLRPLRMQSRTIR